MVGMDYAEVHYDSLRSLVCEYQRSNPSVFDEHYFEEEEYNIKREQYIQEILMWRQIHLFISFTNLEQMLNMILFSR
jgi:hypothetical protein